MSDEGAEAGDDRIPSTEYTRSTARTAVYIVKSVSAIALLYGVHTLQLYRGEYYTLQL